MAGPPLAMELTNDQVEPWSVLAYMSILVLPLSAGIESPAAMIVPTGIDPTAWGSSYSTGSSCMLCQELTWSWTVDSCVQVWPESVLRNTGMPLFEYCSNEASRVPLASAL